MTGTYVPISCSEVRAGTRWVAAKGDAWRAPEVEHSADADGRRGMYMRARGLAFGPEWSYFAYSLRKTEDANSLERN